MSRTRIVKGKYTKIIGEDYNISSEGNISYNAGTEVRDKGTDKGVFYGEYEKLGSSVSDDFEIKFSLKKDKTYSTLVPFGILDYNDKYENANFVFDYSLMLGNIDSLEFKILNEDGSTLYAITNLPEIVVTMGRLPLLAEDIVKQKPASNPLKPTKTWDWKNVFDSYNISSNDYTKIGSYVIFWDGFDDNELYDSAKFNNKKFKAVITAHKNGAKKTVEVEFNTEYSEVDWVDVKIDRKNKKIDTTLRVNLKDGGVNGLECTELTNAYDPSSTIQSCPWDKIPKSKVKSGQPIIKGRIKKFEELEKLAIDGLNYHWGRNKDHSDAKNVNISGELYEVYVNAMNIKDKSMDDVSLVYNTNGKWMRSGNPGSATSNPISWIGNAVSREAICYNIGYIKYSNDWDYIYESDENTEFKFTSAHEIGHEILKSYGGTFYSYGHKGSVNTVTQSMKENAETYNKDGEIDIMPYYPIDPPLSLYSRYAAAEKDVLSLIWLTKIQIK